MLPYFDYIHSLLRMLCCWRASRCDVTRFGSLYLLAVLFFLYVTKHAAQCNLPSDQKNGRTARLRQSAMPHHIELCVYTTRRLMRERSREEWTGYCEMIPLWFGRLPRERWLPIGAFTLLPGSRLVATADVIIRRAEGSSTELSVQAQGFLQSGMCWQLWEEAMQGYSTYRVAGVCWRQWPHAREVIRAGCTLARLLPWYQLKYSGGR